MKQIKPFVAKQSDKKEKQADKIRLFDIRIYDFSYGGSSYRLK